MATMTIKNTPQRTALQRREFLKMGVASIGFFAAGCSTSLGQKGPAFNSLSNIGRLQPPDEKRIDAAARVQVPHRGLFQPASGGFV